MRSILVSSVLLVGCSAPSSSVSFPAIVTGEPAWFEDVTAAKKIDFRHEPGPVGECSMPQIVGSGGAFCDLDGDGRDDLLLLTNGGPNSTSKNALYRQNADGSFADVSEGSALNFAAYSMGVAVGDIDNDGRPDVLITEYRGARLFRNEGGMKFRDITNESQLNNPFWGMSAAFFDFDRDGWLDLVIANYVDYDPSQVCRTATGERDYCAPKVFKGTPTKLFRNLGQNPVKFADVTIPSGLVNHMGPGLGVVCADFTGDDWPDIFVANDGKPNHLFVNRQNGTFREEAITRGIAYNYNGLAMAGMGIAINDLDRDGLWDLFVTHLTTETNTLWKQGPSGLFKDVSSPWGLTSTRWRATGFGTIAEDFDADGWPDLAIVNGRVFRDPTPPRDDVDPNWSPYAERNQLLAHTGQNKFRDISHTTPALCSRRNVARGLATADFDQDGAMDLLVTRIGDQPQLLRNVAAGSRKYLQIRAMTGPRDALGATIVVHASGTKQHRLIHSGDSYLTARSPIAHFGLNDAEKFDSVDVVWPDGKRESFPGAATNQRLTIRQGEGVAR